jgi:hypothetical protein
MEKFDSVGITSHFDNLPYGSKDAFIREVADALGLSSSSVRKKIQNGNWRKLEIPIITKLIQK